MNVKNRKNLATLSAIVAVLLMATALIGGFVNVPSSNSGTGPQVTACQATGQTSCCLAKNGPEQCNGGCCLAQNRPEESGEDCCPAGCCLDDCKECCCPGKCCPNKCCKCCCCPGKCCSDECDKCCCCPSNCCPTEGNKDCCPKEGAGCCG